MMRLVAFGLVNVFGVAWMLWLKSNVASPILQGGLFVAYLILAERVAHLVSRKSSARTLDAASNGARRHHPSGNVLDEGTRAT